MLREVGAAGCEHAGDLRPPDGGRVPAGHQVEGAVGEGQRRLLGIGDDDGSERMQEGRRPRQVWRPAFGGDQRRREVLGAGAGEHLTTAGLDVQRGRGRGELPAEKPLVAPRRALLGGAAVEP